MTAPAIAPVVAPSAIFSGIGAAKVRVDANYERAGHYLLRIDKIKLDRNRKGDVFLAVEKTVVKVLDDDAGKGHKLGEGVCHMMMAKHDSFLGNVKGMLANLMGMRPEQIEPKHAEMICLPDQPLTGMVAECRNRQIMTKDNKPFTAINYKREVPPAELLAVLDPTVIRDFFPNDTLQKLIAFDAAPAATPAAA